MGVGPEQNHGFGASRGRRCVVDVGHAISAAVVVVEQRRRRRRRRCWWSGIGGRVTGNGRVKADDSVRACELPTSPILKRLWSEWRACGRTSCSRINGAAGSGAVDVRHRHRRRRRHREQRPPPRTPSPLSPSTPRTLPPPPLPPSRRDLQIAATTAAADRREPSPSPPTPPPPPPFARRNGDASDATFSLHVYPLPGFQTETTTSDAEELARFRYAIAAVLNSPTAEAEIACTCCCYYYYYYIYSRRQCRLTIFETFYELGTKGVRPQLIMHIICTRNTLW